MQNLLPKIKRKVLFKNFQSPGDIVILSAAIRDLKLSHPDIEIGLDCSCKEIFENNPYIVPFGSMKKGDPGVEFYKAEYPLIHESNEGQYHFIHGFRKWMEDTLDLKIKATKFKGDIHLSDEERGWMSQIEEMGIKDKFWVVDSGCKGDFNAKVPNPLYIQEVINYFKGKITFVQIGQKEHWHPPLKNVINLIGKTDLRQLIRLVYQSIGILTPVSLPMHLSAAVESKHGLDNRPCVIIAGSRESSVWEAYNGHTYLHTCGFIESNENGVIKKCGVGCWKSRSNKEFDQDKKDSDDEFCLFPEEIDYKYKNGKNLRIARCINIIKPIDIIRAIEKYYEGGVLTYGSTTNNNIKVKTKRKRSS